MSEPGLPNPYVGPRSFRETDAPVFFGREHELGDLLRMVISERIVLLYAPSGAGKTSLLRAGMIPALRKEGFHVYPIIRVSRDLPGDGPAPHGNRFIASTLLSLQEETGDGEAPAAISPESGSLSLTGTLDALRQRASAASPDAPRYDVLVFDQFEEVLTTEPASLAVRKERYAFFEAVAEALYDQNRWAVFSIREDYLAGLDPFRRPIPTRLANHFRLDLLNLAGARRAISEPARVAGDVVFEDEALTGIVTNLSRPASPTSPEGVVEPGQGNSDGIYVEPLHLQVVCDRLWEALRPTAGARITPDQIGTLANVDTALRQYYDDEVRRIAKESPHFHEREIRDWFDTKLILGDPGFRGQVPQEAERSGGLDNRTIAMLVAAKLVNQEARLKNIWYELSHDRLVGPVRRSNADWYRHNLQDFQRAAMAWVITGERPAELLRLRAYLRARAVVKRERIPLRDDEYRFLQQSRSALWQRYSIPLFTILVILSLLVGWFVAPGESEGEILARDANAWARSALALLPNNEAVDLDLGLLLSAEAVGQLDRRGMTIGYEETSSLFRGVVTQPSLIGPVRNDRPPGNPGGSAGMPRSPTGRVSVPVVALDADGRHIASWDPASSDAISLTAIPGIPFGAAKTPLRPIDIISRSGAGVTAMAFLSGPGSDLMLAVGTAKGTVEVWGQDPRFRMALRSTLDPGVEESCVEGEPCPGVTWLSAGAGGALVAGYADGSVITWNETSPGAAGPAVTRIACPESPPERNTPCGQVNGIATMADGSLVISYSGGVLGRITDPGTGPRAGELDGLPQDADILAVAEVVGVDGEVIMVVRTGGRFQVGVTGVDGIYRPLRDQPTITGMTDVVILPGDPAALFWSQRDGQIIRWSPSGASASLAPATGFGIDSLELSADGRRLASRADDGLVQLWDTSGISLPGQAASWPVPLLGSCVVDLSFDGERIQTRAQAGATADADLGQLPMIATPVTIVATGPAASGTPTSPNPFALPRSIVSATAAATPTSAAQPAVATGLAPSGPGIRCIDAHRLSPGQLAELPGNPQPADPGVPGAGRVYGVASMDDDVRATVDEEDDVAVYLRSGDGWRQGGSLDEPESTEITLVAISDNDIGNGDILAVGYRDGAISLWMHDGGVWKPLGRLSGHDAPITALRFHPGAQYLGTGDESGVVIVWNLEPADWVTYACFRAGRTFDDDEITPILDRNAGEWKPICAG